jgi:cytochrome P450
LLSYLRFAGHDTTSHTLAFALYHIVNDPEILKKVMAEINDLTFNTKVTRREERKIELALIDFIG